MRAFYVLLEDVVDDRIDVLVAVLDEHGKAVLDGHLELLEKVRVVERDHLQVVLLLLLLDPLERLLLRIDAIGEATRLRCQDAVLHGQLVGRQAFAAPSLCDCQHSIA